MVYHIDRVYALMEPEFQIYSGGHMFTSDGYDPETFAARVRPGDFVVLGRHILERQMGDADVLAPMQWLVLEKSGSRLLLLNRYQILLTLAGDSNKPFRYKDSYIRKELCENLPLWFEDWELGLIADTHLGETKNPAYATKDDPDVSDKLFLLTAEEVLRYFDPKAYARMDKLLDTLVPNGFGLHYFPMCDAGADAQVVTVGSPLHTMPENGRTKVELEICDFLGWWTRTPGSEDGAVALYESGGKLNLTGLDAESDEVGVRPALWLDMEKLKPLITRQ